MVHDSLAPIIIMGHIAIESLEFFGWFLVFNGPFSNIEWSMFTPCTGSPLSEYRRTSARTLKRTRWRPNIKVGGTIVLTKGRFIGLVGARCRLKCTMLSRCPLEVCTELSAKSRRSCGIGTSGRSLSKTNGGRLRLWLSSRWS